MKHGVGILKQQIKGVAWTTAWSPVLFLPLCISISWDCGGHKAGSYNTLLEAWDPYNLAVPNVTIWATE